MRASIEQIDPNFAAKISSDELHWYDARLLNVEGQGWADGLESPFDRLPLRAKEAVDEHVWHLSHHSAGICVRFQSDSGKISVRWKLISDVLASSHMPATARSGVDLYARELGRWRCIGVSKSIESREPRCEFATEPAIQREYALYLPLYNGVTEVRIGIEPQATIGNAPLRTGSDRPIVFYGTSIVQGGCASRPGMAYPAILGRWLDCPTINLGFSGNGKMQPQVLPFIAELDPLMYVLDPYPNLDPPLIVERTESFIRGLRDKHPHTPIVLIENIIYQNILKDHPAPRHEPKNRQARLAFQHLIAAGIGNLHLIPADDLLGTDFEGTVDGTHLTDLGFMRFAEAVFPTLKAIGLNRARA